MSTRVHMGPYLEWLGTWNKIFKFFRPFSIILSTINMNFSFNSCPKNYLVKHVTWILMEIPCHFSSRIDGSLVEIHTKFHDYSMSFIQISFVCHTKTWHGFWTSSSHGISMAFPKKMMRFPSDLVSFSTKLMGKRHEKIPVTFFTGCK